MSSPEANGVSMGLHSFTENRVHKMEIDDERKPAARHRAVWRCMLIAIVLPFGSPTGWVANAQKGQTRNSIPEAPLPTAVVNAKKVFLLDGQTTAEGLTKNGNALAFDTLYAEVKSWSKYELVDSPKDADIVVELQYRPYSGSSRSFGVYNPSSRTVQSRTVAVPSADFALVVYDAKSKDQLWAATDACGVARLVKNQQKEVIKSVGRLVDGLKRRTTTMANPDPH